ncbi:TPA: hypothetical protein ACUNBO_002087 [Morganella morganii]
MPESWLLPVLPAGLSAPCMVSVNVALCRRVLLMISLLCFIAGVITGFAGAAWYQRRSAAECRQRPENQKYD